MREAVDLSGAVLMANRICLFKALSLIVFLQVRLKANNKPPKNQTTHRFLHGFNVGAFKTNSKLSFINSVAHGVCRLGF